MQQEQFDAAIIKKTKIISDIISDPILPHHICLSLTYLQAQALEQELNSLSQQQEQTNFYILQPIREQNQVMYKQGLTINRVNDFEQDQIQYLKEWLESMQETITKPIIGWRLDCLLIIKLLNQYPEAKYFKHCLDPILLRRSDLKDRLPKQLSLSVITQRLCRGDYEKEGDFRMEMNEMIYGMRANFVSQLDIFRATISFEAKYKQINNIQLKKYKESLLKYRKKISALSKPKQRKKKAQKKTYTIDQRKALKQRINLQPSEIKYEIMKYLQVVCANSLQSGKISLDAIRNEVWANVQQMLKPQIFYEEEEQDNKQPRVSLGDAINQIIDDQLRDNDDDL